MVRFVAQRFAHTLLVLLGVSILAFILIDLAPGQYFQEMRLNPQISRETLTALRIEFGLDRSLPIRYMRWLGSVSRGEWGFSFAYNRPVWPLLRVRAGNTLLLTTTALLCSWTLAIPIGIFAAARSGGWEDQLSGGLTTILLATPDVVIGLGLLAFALHTRWFPIGGMHTLASEEMGMLGKTKDLALHLVLPVSALTAGTLPILVRHMRSSMLDVLNAPFIVAARGHGIPRRRLLLHYALPAATNPLISLLGISVGTLLSGSLLIEVIMNWPGLGPVLLSAIMQRDPYVVVAGVMLSAAFLMAGNLLADVLLYLADPRITHPKIERLPMRAGEP